MYFIRYFEGTLTENFHKEQARHVLAMENTRVCLQEQTMLRGFQEKKSKSHHQRNTLSNSFKSH